MLLTSTLLTSIACGHDTKAPSSSTPTKATPLAGAAPVAIRSVDAPGFNIPDLTAHLRDAFEHSSGIPVVDDFAIQAELAACLEMPCPTTQQDRFKAATTVVATTVSKIGGGFIGAVRVQQGLKEVVRINAQGNDVAELVDELGHRAGAALREALLQPMPSTDEPVSNER